MRNFIFYRGPSAIDPSAPIIGVATIDSSNKKIGPMVQTWILRADTSPVAASRTGLDSAICGGCGHRGKYHADTGLRVAGTRSCYVQLYVPDAIWRTAQRDRYDDLTSDLSEASRRCTGRAVRLGAYGDPAAIPLAVWTALLAHAASHTGYTHQWMKFPEFNELVMASCDSSSDRVMARALGFRTFRVAEAASWQRESGEVLCPASAEAGRKTVCAACRACGGTSSRAKADIVIPAHGGGRKIVTDQRLAA